MPADYRSWAASVQRLHRAALALDPLAARLGAQSSAQDEWRQLLELKLLPQLELDPLLVVAVVGGTNIGKSVVFNHLAGEDASGVSPLAAGTKHPVCLVSKAHDNEQLLRTIFTGFELRRWHSPQDALGESETDLLFWRAGQNTPNRLLLLDTPDIDSGAVVNWKRADQIRQSADVLIAVLTQQKYNDAAVKQFFRKAVEADKPVIVVFNQVDLSDDRDVWPEWLATFMHETGARPEFTYVVPYDRQAARDFRLPFYHIGADGRSPPDAAASLRDDLANLHFDEIKIRAFRGALARIVDPRSGAGAWLDRVRVSGKSFAAAAQALSSAQASRVQWPAVPAPLLVEEIRGWWDARRSEWSRKVHGFYRVVGQGLTWPIRKGWRAATGPKLDPMTDFHARERAAILAAIAQLLEELDRLAEVGNDTLRPRLAKILGGEARARLLQKVTAAHDALPAIDEDYRAILRSELDRWGRENPSSVNTLRSLDHVAAIARPVITVSLAFSGWIVAGDVVGQAAAHAVGHTASQIATEAAIAGGITGGGEAIVSATGEGMQQAAARIFRQLQTRYAEMRATWLIGWLERELLGDLLTELREGASVTESAPYRELKDSIAVLAPHLLSRNVATTAAS